MYISRISFYYISVKSSSNYHRSPVALSPQRRHPKWDRAWCDRLYLHYFPRLLDESLIKDRRCSHLEENSPFCGLLCYNVAQCCLLFYLVFSSCLPIVLLYFVFWSGPHISVVLFWILVMSPIYNHYDFTRYSESSKLLSHYSVKFVLFRS